MASQLDYDKDVRPALLRATLIAVLQPHVPAVQAAYQGLWRGNKAYPKRQTWCRHVLERCIAMDQAFGPGDHVSTHELSARLEALKATRAEQKAEARRLFEEIFGLNG
jgi:hypothetical protein